MTNWYRDLATRIQTVALSEGISEVDAGYMEHAHDIHGLEAYLKQMDVIPQDGHIMPMREFEDAVEDGSAAGNPIYGYYINLDERGEFYADVRDAAGKTIYEVRSENDDEGDYEDDEEEFEEAVNESDEQYFNVSLIARDIQVTAKNETDAYSFAKEDAREFMSSWNYEVSEVRPAPAPDGTYGYDADDAVTMEVSRSDNKKNPWTFTAEFEVYVPATSPEEAAKKAEDLLKGHDL